MDQKDLKAIEGLLEKKLSPINEKLDSHTASLMNLEQKVDVALELRQDVSGLREQAQDHEKRISNLERI